MTAWRINTDTHFREVRELIARYSANWTEEQKQDIVKAMSPDLSINITDEHGHAIIMSDSMDFPFYGYLSDRSMEEFCGILRYVDEKGNPVSERKVKRKLTMEVIEL